MRLLKLSTVTLLLSALYGCGGGGGGVLGAAQVDLSGIAAKGLIQNGKVEVFATDNAGNVGTTPIATTTTGTDGSYTLKISPQANPVVVKVSKGTNTTIVDETAPAGTPAVPMPDNFVMRAVVPSISAASTVGINPFTETAVAAIPAGSFNPTMVKSSNDWVKQNLTGGVDPVSVAPSLSGSSTATDDQKLLAAALTSVAVAAKSANSSCSTEADTAAKFACQVTKLSASVSFKADSSGAVTVASVDGAELAKLSTARTSLATDSAYSATLSNVGISTAVNTLKSDSKLASVVTATGGTKTTDTTALATIAPRTDAAITAGASATAYANNLQAAIKTSGDSIKAQVDKFNATYKDKVLPSLDTVATALQMIDNACSVSGPPVAVTCSTGTISVGNGGSATLSGSGNTFSYSGTGNGQKVAGDVTFTPGTNNLVMKVVGTVPNPESGATVPLTADLQFTLSLDKTAMTFGATVDKASVNFPAGTAVESTVTMTNGKIDGVLLNGNAQRNSSTWPYQYSNQDGPTDQAGLLKSMTGVLAVSTKSGDKLSANLDVQTYVPSQKIWSSLTGQQRFAIKDKFMIEKLSFVAGVDLATGENYSATIIADPDYSKVDLTQAPSSTNYATGYMQLIIDLGKTSASSLAKFDLKLDRTTYDTAKPSISVSVGGFDKLTAVPANTDNTIKIVPTTGSTISICTTASISSAGISSNTTPSCTTTTDIATSAGIWLSLAPGAHALADGLKITSTNSEYVTTIKKDSNGNFNGTIVNKAGSTVGEIKSGVLYIDGSIFALK